MQNTTPAFPLPQRIPLDAATDQARSGLIAQPDGGECVVIASPDAGSAGGVTLEEGDGVLRLRLPQGEFGAYRFGNEVVRPFFSPVMGPGQVRVTRAAENKTDGQDDHPHHRSLFTAYEEANDANNWNEEPGHGFTRHQKFLAREEGPAFGGFTAQSLWTNKDGAPVLTEERRIRLYNVGPEIRLFDYDVALQATHGDVTFGETKEAGVLGVRVQPSMNGSAGGVIINSRGGRGEAQCWGQKAEWCDYSGEVDGEVLGITIFDHPSNPNFPTRWHVRDYGLFATNPLSTASFNAGAPSPFVLRDGQAASFRYRVLIHRNPGESQQLQNVYEQWIA
jgi:hypothetical protein